MVAWDAAVPGIPKRTAGIVSAVQMTECRPMSTAKAVKGSMSKVKGSRIDRPTMPPRPGMAHEDPEREQGEPARDEEDLDGFECGFEHVNTRQKLTQLRDVVRQTQG